MAVSYYDIKKSASKFREDHGLGVKDPINIKGLLIKLKVLSIFKPLASDISGMAIKTMSLRFLLINSNNTIGRQSYTALHELYHLFVQKDFNSSICYAESSTKRNSTDRDAEYFASYALLPELGILDMIPNQELTMNRISLSTILEIEQYYTCSRAALLNRLKELKLINGDKYGEYSQNVIQNAKNYGYDDSLYKSGNHDLIIGDYAKLANILFDKDVISESHYINLMRDIGVNPE